MGRTRRHAGQGTREEFYARFQIVNTDLDKGTFDGYASVFGSLVDAWMPTLLERGAFTKTLAENKERVRILYQHDPRCLIGKPLTLEEDEKGLHIVGKISDTEMGREALTLIRDGVLSEMSIGFDPIQWEMRADPASPLDPTRQVRHLKEVRLWEVSLVTWAADPLAQIYAVHALRTAPAAHRWAPAEALGRVRRWAGFQEEWVTKPVQTVIVSKEKYPERADASKWVRDHDFRADKVDETEESYRYRQFDPGECTEGSERTIELTDGVKAVICAKKESDAAPGPGAGEGGSQRVYQRYSQAFLGGHLVADVVEGGLQLVPLALAEAGLALVVEQAKAMTAEEAKTLLQEARDRIEQILAAAAGDDDHPEMGPDGKPKKKKPEDEEQGRARSREALDARLMELTADAALVGVY